MEAQATKSKMVETEHAKVASPAEWREARVAFLKKEKEFTRLRDELSRERRELPWEKVEKDYVFDGPAGKETLAALFDGRSQLIVYHFMLGPDWKEGCPGCSFVSDHIDGSLAHLNARDVTLVVVSRAPLAQIAEFKKRMGWGFKWVSSTETEFNRDYHVSFTSEDIATGKTDYNYGTQVMKREGEVPGASAFYKDARGEIFHTYSTYARGLESLVGAYNYLDIAPKGRDEGGLASPMAWLRHHDRYSDRYAESQAAK
jgi:predicted dithiol-disulfide oxidoreductase (DUF899 family)